MEKKEINCGTEGKSRVIFIDFSFSRVVSVATAKSDILDGYCAISSGRFYGSKLISSAVYEALKSASADFSEISKIVISKGPGSFTSLRACIAFSQAVSLSMKIPIITLLSFDWIALYIMEKYHERFSEKIEGEKKKVFTMRFFSGKKNLFYFAQYEINQIPTMKKIYVDSSDYTKPPEGKIFDVEREVLPEVGAKYLFKIFTLYKKNSKRLELFEPENIWKIAPEYLIPVEFQKPKVIQVR